MDDIKLNDSILGPSTASGSQLFAQEEAQKANTPLDIGRTLGDAARTTISTELVIGGVERTMASDLFKPIAEFTGVGAFHPDPDSLPKTAADLEVYMTEKNVPQQMWSALAGRAVSRAHLDFMVGNLAEKTSAEQRLHYDGGWGTAVNFGASIFDPVSWAATAGTGGFLKASAQAGLKLSRGAQVTQAAFTPALRHGLGVTEAAISNVAIGELEGWVNGRDVTNAERAIQAGMGVAMYGGLVGVGKGLNKIFSRKANDSTRAAAEAQGAQFTDRADMMNHGELPPQGDANWEQGSLFGDAPVPTTADLETALATQGGELFPSAPLAQPSVRSGKADVAVQFDNGLDHALWLVGTKNEKANDAMAFLEQHIPGASKAELKEAAAALVERTKGQADEAAKTGVNVVISNHYADAVKPVYVRPKAQKGAVKEDVDPITEDLKVDPEVNMVVVPKAVEPAAAPAPVKAAKAKKTHDAVYSRVDADDVALKFENKVDRDLYHMSFDTKPKNAAKIMAGLRKAFPKLDDEEILAAARRMREENIRVRSAEEPTALELEVPAWHTQHVDPDSAKAQPEFVPNPLAVKVAAGTALASVGTAAQAADGEEGDGGIGAMVAAGAVAVGVGLAAKRAGKTVKAAKAATPVHSGDVTPDNVPYTERAMFGRLGDVMPFVPKRFHDVPIGSEYSLLVANSASNVARFLNSGLLSSVAGFANRAVSRNGADGVKETAVQAAITRVSLARTEALDGYLKARGMYRHGVDYRTSVIDEFEEAATRYKRNPGLNEEPYLRKYADEQTKIMGERIDVARRTVEQSKANGTQFADDSPVVRISKLENRPDYVRRVHNYERIRNMVAEAGHGNVSKAVGQFIRDLDPLLSREASDNLGTAYVDFVLRVEANPAIARLANLDPSAALQKMVELGWVKGDKADDVLDVLVMFGPENAPGVTRRRIQMNENGTYRATLADGTGYDIKASDFFVNDATIWMNDWLNQVEGNVALAQWGARYGVDFSSEKVFEAFLNAARREGMNVKEEELVRASWAHVKGDVGHTTAFGEPTKVGSSIRAMASLMMGKGFIFSVLPEGVSGLIGAHLARAQRRAFPGMQDAFRMITARAPNDPVNRQIAAAMGLGAENIGSIARNQMEHGIEEAVSRNVQVTVAKAFKYNLFAGLNNMFKSWSARAFMQMIADHANGVNKLPDEWIERTLHPLGMNKADLDKAAVLLNKHAEFDNKGILKAMNFEAIQKEDALFAATLTTTVRKYSKGRASEANAIGETSPLMRTEVGKFLLQFMAPVIHIHNKLRRDAGNMTVDVAATWFCSFMGAAGSYYMRTYLDYGDNQKELDKRLAMSEVMKVAFRNSVMAGLSTSAVDLAAWTVGMPQPFANASNSGRPSFQPPVLAAATNVLGAARTATNAVTGDDVTRGESRRAMQVLQMSQWMMTPVINAITEDLPEKRPKKQNQGE